MPSHQPAKLQLPDEALALLGLTAEEAGGFAPGSVNIVETKRGPVWLKVLGPKPHRPMQYLLRGLMSFLPAAALGRTPSGKGGDTLLRQAEQAETLRRSGFHTPETIFVNRSFFITADAGITLDKMLQRLAKDSASSTEIEKFRAIVAAATDEIARLHAAGLAHGRPKMRDIAWMQNDAGEARIVLIDLEERPWETMSMSDAQARDIVLWLVDLCSHDLTREMAHQAGEKLCAAASADVLASLKKVVRATSPFTPLATRLLSTRQGSREIRGGLAAHAILKQQLANSGKRS